MQGVSIPQHPTTTIKEHNSFSKSIIQAHSFHDDSQSSGETFNLVQTPFDFGLLTEEQKLLNKHPDETSINEQKVMAEHPQDTSAVQGAFNSVINEIGQQPDQKDKLAQSPITSEFKSIAEHVIKDTKTQMRHYGDIQNQTVALPQAKASLLPISLVNSQSEQAGVTLTGIDAKLFNTLNTDSQNNHTVQPTPSQSSPTTTTSPTIENRPEWAMVSIDKQAGKWGEQMLQVLHDRVTLQAQQNLQEAKIRLDPPDLGKLDLVVRIEGDRLSVQINANNAVTREALAQISDRLRTELQEQNFVNVDVNVGSEQRNNQQNNRSLEDQGHGTFTAKEQPVDPDEMPISEHWLSTQA